MPTLLHKDVTNHECNWRTVIYCINYFSDVVNCLLKLQVIAMPILYHILYIDRVLNHLRQYCQMLPQEVMYFCIFMYFPMAWETLLLRLPGHQFLQVFGHWWSWLLGLWQSNVLKKNQFCSWILGNPRTWSKESIWSRLSSVSCLQHMAQSASYGCLVRPLFSKGSNT